MKGSEALSALQRLQGRHVYTVQMERISERADLDALKIRHKNVKTVPTAPIRAS